ncbi:MAG: PilZ domain-containing protein [Deltaproteobacteria bacterium]|nr:PilZ domain-containing protein [Deltaproteobacteria bacterium]
MNFFQLIASFFKKDAPARVLKKKLSLDQRGFDRYSVKFAVMVSGRDEGEGIYREKSFLHDISGGGAMFVTAAPEKYSPGQLLKISIFLSGTNDVRARIRTEAVVVRIHPMDEKGDGRPQHAGVAVTFDRSFEFERIDESEYR